MQDVLDFIEAPAVFENFGEDGRCDHDGGCRAIATMAVLSAVAPVLWEGAVAACVAYLCADHVADEPIAARVDAERNMQDIEIPTAREVWARLLAFYPDPVRFEFKVDEPVPVDTDPFPEPPF